VSSATFGLLPWMSRSQHDLAAKLCPTHNFVFLHLKLFHRNDPHIETCQVQHLGRYLEGQGHSMTLKQNRVRPIWSQILKIFNISQKWSTYWDDVSRGTLGLLFWRPMSQHDLAAKSCPFHNFVIWSLILQLFLTNYFYFSNTYSGSVTRFNRLLFSLIFYL